MSSRKHAALLFMTLALAAPARAAEPILTIDLWPGTPPGETGKVAAESLVPSKKEERSQRKVTNVTRPTLAVFRPKKEIDTGAAVVIAPGGGYFILAYDLEGEEVAAWLNSIGVTGIVLKYRVPRRPDQPGDQPPSVALMDAQRAVSLVRSKAGELGIDPKRVGMLGFSAGGHLTAWTATNWDNRTYSAVDAADQVSCRPDFAILVYPAYLQKRGEPTALAPEIRVNAETPPCFFAHAGDDPISAENSVVMYLAAKRAKTPSELHLFSKGSTGSGLRPTRPPPAPPGPSLAEWMKTQGLARPHTRPRGSPGRGPSRRRDMNRRESAHPRARPGQPGRRNVDTPPGPRAPRPTPRAADQHQPVRPGHSNTELPFADVFRLSPSLDQPAREGKVRSGPAARPQPEGWVRRLEPGAGPRRLPLHDPRQALSRRGLQRAVRGARAASSSATTPGSSTPLRGASASGSTPRVKCSVRVKQADPA
ncbi:MAG: alpha/beta hydrolase fold domain-containing protein [Isosphaeraceae bacterium]